MYARFDSFDMGNECISDRKLRVMIERKHCEDEHDLND